MFGFKGGHRVEVKQTSIYKNKFIRLNLHTYIRTNFIVVIPEHAQLENWSWKCLTTVSHKCFKSQVHWKCPHTVIWPQEEEILSPSKLSKTAVHQLPCLQVPTAVDVNCFLAAMRCQVEQRTVFKRCWGEWLDRAITWLCKNQFVCTRSVF